MADKSDGLILDALKRATTSYTGMPLFGSRSAKGLFDNTRPAKAAAERALHLDFLRNVGAEANGKPHADIYVITESGLEHVLNNTDPTQILSDLIQVIETRESQIAELAGGARDIQASLQGLKKVAEAMLARTRVPEASEVERGNGLLLEHLSQWRLNHPAEDCPLSELCRLVRRVHPAMSLGRFHDILRTLHEEGRIYLHPWTGPLYDLPEPVYALLSGHEIVYYASLRGTKTEVDGRRSDIRTTAVQAGL